MSAVRGIGRPLQLLFAVLTVMSAPRAHAQADGAPSAELRLEVGGARYDAEVDRYVSTDGKFTLHWVPRAALGGDGRFVLEGRDAELTAGGESSPPRVEYTGTARSRVLSGLADGVRVYRVRIEGADRMPAVWSEPVTVEVRHHSLSVAFAYLAVGAFVFVCTTLVVVGGARRTAGGTVSAP